MYNFKLSYKSRVFLTIIIKHGKTRDFSNSKISRTSIKASFLARILFKQKLLRYPLRVAMFRINRDCNGYFNKVARCLIKL